MIVFNFKFDQNWLSGYRDVRSQNLGSCITLANSLYSNVLPYRHDSSSSNYNNSNNNNDDNYRIIILTLVADNLTKRRLTHADSGKILSVTGQSVIIAKY